MSFVRHDERIPGVVQEHRLQRQAGGLQLSERVLLIGARSSAADDTRDFEPIPIRSRSDSQNAFHAGSQLDLMVRAALATGALATQDAKRGGTPELNAMAIPPATGEGTAAATQTVTFEGTASNQGEIRAAVNDLVVTIGVLSGQEPATIASAFRNALDAITADISYTTTVIGAAVRFTARELGEWGQELFLDLDTSNVGDVSATIARSQAGAGLVDLEQALDASLAEDFDCVVLPQSDPETRTLAREHIQAAWDYTNQRYRILVMGSSQDLASAQTAAAELDDFRIVLASAEKIADTGQPFARKHSSRSHGFEVAASVGTRLYTQRRPNHNYNHASVSVHGRPTTINRANVNDAINAGVTMVLADGKGGGQIVDPIATAITDPLTGAASTEWQPIEIAKVVQTMTRSIQVELATFSRSDADDTTLDSARAAALAVLETGADERLIRPVSNDDATAKYELVGASTRLVILVRYGVITGIDIVAVTHNITR